MRPTPKCRSTREVIAGIINVGPNRYRHSGAAPDELGEAQPLFRFYQGLSSFPAAMHGRVL